MNAIPYPLCWPASVKRTMDGNRRASPFGKGSYQKPTVSAAVREVKRELHLWGIPEHSVCISTNVTVGSENAKDPGVAVYFTNGKKPMCVAADKWTRVGCNLRAIAKTLEALRAFDRWGVTTGEQLLSHFTALPAPGDVQARTCWTVLEIAPTQSHSAINNAWKLRALVCHPDITTGSHELMTELNTARDQAAAQATQP